MAADRVAVLGAGSVGCFIGGCWQAAAVPVTFVGRPSFARDIAEHGLTLSDFTGWSTRVEHTDYHTDPAAVGEADIIALCVKSGATADAAQNIARHGRQGALVISFQNGISNVDVLRGALGDRFAVVRGMVPFNVAYLGDGRFHKGVAGDLFAEETPETRMLVAKVGGGPAALKLSDDMLALAWGKLLINLNNAVNALSGRPLLEQLRQRDYRRVVAASQREALRLLKRAGITPAKVGAVGPRLIPAVIGAPDWLFNSLFARGWKIDERARSSMADDLTAGRRTEIDYINGELVALAHKLGTNAPVNERIVELIRRAEEDGERWPPGELRRAVLGR